MEGPPGGGNRHRMAARESRRTAVWEGELELAGAFETHPSDGDAALMVEQVGDLGGTWQDQGDQVSRRVGTQGVLMMEHGM